MLKNKNNRYFLFFTFIFILIFFSATYAFAAEVLPGSTGDASKDLSTYISYLFKIGVYLAAGIALVSFVIGAVGRIVAGDSTGAMGESNDRMKGAVLGLVLVACSWLIMNTINPKILQIDLGKPGASTPTDIVPGVYYYLNSSDCNASKTTSTGSSSTSGTGSGGSTVSKNTGSGAIIASEPSLKAPYYGEKLAFKIINDPKNNIKFGIVVHQTSGFENGGICSDIITSANCTTINVPAGAIEVLKLSSDPKYSGNGVSFYSDDFGWDTGSRSGFIDIPASAIVSPYSKGAPGDYNFLWTNVAAADAHIKACTTFQDCPGSIKINGSYLVALYSTNNYCQTFSKDVPHMDVQPFLKSGNRKIDTVYIVPLK